MPLTERRHGLQVDHPRYVLIPKIGMSLAPLSLFAGALPLLRKQMQDGDDFDLIDAHYFYPDGVAAVLLGRVLRKPVVITARGDDLDLISTYSVPRRLIRWAATRAAGLITVSNGLKGRLVELGTPPDRIRTLRNGVDLTKFRPQDRAAARQALRFNRPTILAVGNLVPKKRHVLAVEALRHLHQVDLAIVGEGPERSRIEAVARKLGVADRVRLLGRQAQERLPEIYTAADVLTHPSLREGWPNVLLESMACGTPVVAGNFRGVEDIITEPSAGRIVREATPASLAAAIGELLRAGPMRVETRQYAAAFDWNSTSLGQIELFTEITHAHAGAIASCADSRLE
jgi:glycosyltransferase involved in cell wall biosynthesis